MLVVCPKCFTQYAVSDEIKVPEGQKFHCFACNHYFVLQSGSQNGFYEDSESGENEEIPTVSSVMNAQQNESIPAQEDEDELPVQQPAVLETNNKNESNRNTDSPKGADSKEPLAFLANEKPQVADRLDSLPEAFQPVGKNKKQTSAIGALFWLCVAGGICYGAFSLLKQNPVYETLETVISMALDKKSLADELAKQAESETVPAPTATERAAQPIDEDLTGDEQQNAANQAEMIRTEEEKDTPPQEQAAPALPVVQAQEQVKPNEAPEEPVIEQTPSQEELAAQEEAALQAALAKAVADQELKAAEEAKRQAMEQEEQARREAQARLEEQLAEQEAVNVSNPTQIMLAEMHKADGEVPVIEGNPFAQPVQNDLEQKSVEASPHNEDGQESVENTVQNGADGFEQAQIQQPQQAVLQQAPNEPEQQDNVQAPRQIAEPVQNMPQQVKLSPAEANRILSIQDVSYELAHNEAGVMRLMIKGIIANTELQKVIIPELKAVVYNQEDMVVARKRIILAQPEIEGNSVQAFFSSVVPAPEQISHVEVLFDE